MRFLLIEDNKGLSQAITERLELDGHIVDGVSDVSSANTMQNLTSYDLILLDLTLPDGDGREVLRHLRNINDLTPIIVITASREISERVKTLDLGADDFLVKPFDFAELEARVRAVLRRKRGDARNQIEIGNVSFDQLDGTLTIDGEPVTLRTQELRLFEALVDAPDRVHSKEHLMDRLFSFGDEGSSNAIEVYIGRLRRKLEHSNLKIETVRGRGYRILCP
ncbi:response regulator transcription factor [Ruegeria lacuscaerulensis]|uniref:response regulator transcription factor n=1 Tax=Ruegeria lacuscaerulensis TaxID=55218 RepID=UPI001479AA23|nr:response regulator transcription factor [Ruegeria lacuscaerulensis]